MIKLRKEYMACMLELKTVSGDIGKNFTMGKGKILPEAGGYQKV